MNFFDLARAVRHVERTDKRRRGDRDLASARAAVGISNNLHRVPDVDLWRLVADADNDRRCLLRFVRDSLPGTRSLTRIEPSIRVR